MFSKYISIDLVYILQAKQCSNDFIARVKVVCLTDSSYWGDSGRRAHDYWQHLIRVTRNWITSGRPIGAVEKRRNGVFCVSAGTQVHEETSSVAMSSVFAYIDDQLSDNSGMHLLNVSNTTDDSLQQQKQHESSIDDNDKNVDESPKPDVVEPAMKCDETLSIASANIDDAVESIKVNDDGSPSKVDVVVESSCVDDVIKSGIVDAIA